MATEIEIYTLHRYYIWADRMRVHLEQVLTKHGSDYNGNIDANLYMSFWYGALYVVIEGWRELKLEDENINTLLKSPNVDLLKRYRNGVFHFQKNYYDERFLEFIRDGENCVEWIRKLNKEFGRYFLSWYKEIGIDYKQPNLIHG